MEKISLKDILWNLKIDSLTLMQQNSIDIYRKGRDMVLLAPTGSGKTLAYLIPLVLSLTDEPLVQALVLVPSRELAQQIEQVFKSMSTGFVAMSCYGGRPAMDEHRLMKSIHPQVIIATPGRMNDHLNKGNVDVSALKTLVIDEFDKCLELGFREEMGEVISRLPELERRFLLSATDAADIPVFMPTENFLKLDFLVEGEQIPERIKLFVVRSEEKDKLQALFGFLCSQGVRRMLVFVNYRESAERVYQFLRKSGLSVSLLHGGMEQRDREKALYRFVNGSCNILVSTDLASRGLDIPQIDGVVHYHLPLNEDAYIHRNGRTARWDADGEAYVLLGPEEEMPAYVRQSAESYVIPSHIPEPAVSPWVTLYIGKGKKDKIGKVDIVGFLSKVGGLKAEEIGRIDVKDHDAYVAVNRGRVKSVLKSVAGQKIKGIKTIIEETR